MIFARFIFFTNHLFDVLFSMFDCFPQNFERRKN